MSSPAWIHTRPLPGSTWEALLEACPSQDAEVLHYREGLHECAFAWASPSGYPPADHAWEGRVVFSQAELRWVRDPDGKLRGWLLTEHAEKPGHDDAVRVRSTDRKYYLLGTADTAAECFREARYPKPFKYPVKLDGKATGDTRAWIMVREYQRAPDWSQLNDDECLALLEQPMVVAHRYLRLGAG